MAARLLIQVVVWGVTLIVARLLTPFDYGVMTAGMVFVGLADMLAEAGLGRALIQKDGLRPTDVAGAFTVSLALTATLYGALYTLAPAAAAFLAQPVLIGCLPVLGRVVLTIPLRTVAPALLYRELRLGRQASIHVLCSVVQSATVLVLALTRPSYWALAAGVILARVLEAAALLAAARWRPRLLWPTREHRGLVVFGLQASLGT